MKENVCNKINLILAIFTIVIILLMYIFPLSNDDFLHGASGFVFNFMHKINGRYLGNISGVFLSVSIFLRVIIKSLVIILIILITKKLLKIKENIYLLIFVILFMFMPKEMFKQTIPFTAGFANYIIPIVGILFVIYVHLNDVYKRHNIFLATLFLLLGIFNSLFVEHYTIFNLMLSIYLIIYNYVKNKKINYIYLAYLIGSLFGAIIMFTNPNYLASFNGEDPHSYRSLSTVKELFIKPWIIFREAFFHNKALNLTLIVLTSSIYKNKIKVKNIITKLMIVFIWFFGFYSIIKVFNQEWLILKHMMKPFESSITFIFFICIGYLLYKSKLYQKNDIYRLSFYIISMIMVLAPLVMVSPLWPRCYAFTYIIMIIFILDLLLIIVANKIINIRSSSNLLIIVAIIQMTFFLNIYGAIYLKNRERIKIVKRGLEQGDEIIKIEALPNPDFIHGTICSQYDKRVFKVYYKIPVDVLVDVSC